MASYSKPLVSSDKKVKILLIEDDERQINYAQQVLAGHELTVMRSWKQLGDPSDLFRQFDFIITDLMLPLEREDGSKSTPDWKVGLGIYTKALASLDLGEIKGVALVSNYEHHVENARESGWDHDEVKREIMHAPQSAYVSSVGKRIEWDRRGGQIISKVVSMVDHPMNYLAIFDRSIWLMTEFLDQKGQVRVVTEVPEGIIPREFFREQSLSIIKPYKEVIDALLMDLQ